MSGNYWYFFLTSSESTEWMLSHVTKNVVNQLAGWTWVSKTGWAWILAGRAFFAYLQVLPFDIRITAYISNNSFPFCVEKPRYKTDYIYFFRLDWYKILLEPYTTSEISFVITYKKQLPMAAAPYYYRYVQISYCVISLLLEWTSYAGVNSRICLWPR